MSPIWVYIEIETDNGHGHWGEHPERMEILKT